MLPHVLANLGFAAGDGGAAPVAADAAAHGFGKRQRHWHPYLTALLGVFRAAF